MDTFFQYWPWSFIAMCAVAVYIIWVAHWSRFDPLRSPLADTSDAPEPWSPLTYTAENVTLKGMHCIVIDGALRQKFHVQEVRGSAFLVRVFPHGDPADGQGRAHFTGWATQLPSNQLIHPWDLQSTPSA